MSSLNFVIKVIMIFVIDIKNFSFEIRIVWQLDCNVCERDEL